MASAKSNLVFSFEVHSRSVRPGTVSPVPLDIGFCQETFHAPTNMPMTLFIRLASELYQNNLRKQKKPFSALNPNLPMSIWIGRIEHDMLFELNHLRGQGIEEPAALKSSLLAKGYAQANAPGLKLPIGVIHELEPAQASAIEKDFLTSFILSYLDPKGACHRSVLKNNGYAPNVVFTACDGWASALDMTEAAKTDLKNLVCGPDGRPYVMALSAHTAAGTDLAMAYVRKNKPAQWVIAVMPDEFSEVAGLLTMDSEQLTPYPLVGHGDVSFETFTTLCAVHPNQVSAIQQLTVNPQAFIKLAKLVQSDKISQFLSGMARMHQESEDTQSLLGTKAHVKFPPAQELSDAQRDSLTAIFQRWHARSLGRTERGLLIKELLEQDPLDVQASLVEQLSHALLLNFLVEQLSLLRFEH